MPSTPPSPARRRSIRRIGLAAAAPAWCGATGAADGGREADAGAVLQARLAVQGVGLLAVQVEGSRVRLTARGRRRHGGGDLLREDALFEIGSITKTFTALLLADAVVQRRFALDDAVEDVLPGVRLRDSAGEPIRWVDLATHRSGLPRLPDNMAPADPADPYADYGEARLLEFLRRHRPERPRGLRWEYSNLGYGLLGHALGRAAGIPYADLLQRRVLTPLGLTDAVLLRPGASPAGLADGHDADGRPVPHWHFDVMAPAGGLVMGGASLARYAQAALGLADHPLREAFALAQREHAAGPGPTNPIGLAWLRAPLNGRTVLNHDGGTFGFSGSLWLDPANRRGCAVLANAMVEVNDLALHLLEPSVPPKDLRTTRQPAVPLPAQALAPLAGSYALNADFAITVRPRDDRLFAQATGQGEIELFAAAPRRFFARVTPLEIEFDAAPTPTTLTLRQGGQVLRFERRP